jgi:GT2 family glycosyltransferase
MYRAEALKEVGLFDEEFWMYNEDEDHGWRFWLAGWRVVLAPEAVVYHKYEFAKSIKQYYWMDRNRILCILKNYSLLILLLILPAFIIMEFGLVLFSLKGGWFKEKIKVWFYFLNPLKWVYIIQARRDSQAVRKIKDKDIVDLISGRIWYQEIDDWKLRFINPVFEFYWRIVKRIIS